MSRNLYPWDAYARVQQKLHRSRKLDDQVWGLEAGLNRLLTHLDEPAGAAEAELAARSASRRERHHAELRRLHFGVEDLAGDTEDIQEGRHRPRVVKQHALAALCGIEACLDSRHRLSTIEQLLTTDELALLRAVAEGQEYDEIAMATKMRAGVLRVRVCRLRGALVALAA
jgi:hypothetical protein